MCPPPPPPPPPAEEGASSPPRSPSPPALEVVEEPTVKPSEVVQSEEAGGWNLLQSLCQPLQQRLSSGFRGGEGLNLSLR